MFNALARRGTCVMLPNADVHVVRELYRDYVIDVVRATRSVNINAGRRGAIIELVIWNFHST